MANTKKYVSFSKLSIFLENLKNTFSSLGHKHTLSDIADYEVDVVLSNTSTNPVQNKVLDAEFEAIAQAMEILEQTIDGKSDTSHNHDSAYDASGSANNALTLAKDYADEKIDAEAGNRDAAINIAINTEVDNRNAAIDAAKASAISTAASDATAKANASLDSAKAYADSIGSTVKNDLLNGAGAAYDTLKELGDLIDDNTDAIDALETVAAGKADAEHAHAISDVTGLRSALDGKSNSGHTHSASEITGGTLNGSLTIGSGKVLDFVTMGGKFRIMGGGSTDTASIRLVDNGNHVIEDILQVNVNTGEITGGNLKTALDSKSTITIREW